MKLTPADKLRLAAVLAETDRQTEIAIELGKGQADFRARHADRFAARMMLEERFGLRWSRRTRRNGTDWRMS